jgi:hypothetical protein
MSSSNNNPARKNNFAPPRLARNAAGEIESDSLADVIQWFLNYDERVAVVRHPRVEEIFQWKQRADREAGEDVLQFDSAEDRLAIGIFQAVRVHGDEQTLHEWISQLLNALDEATRTNEEIASAYELNVGETASPVAEAEKIPTRAARALYLTCCWLETLCTAEIRVLGWIYQEIYGRPFHPNNFAADDFDDELTF